MSKIDRLLAERLRLSARVEVSNDGRIRRSVDDSVSDMLYSVQSICEFPRKLCQVAMLKFFP